MIRTIVVSAIGIMIPLTPLGAYIGLVPLSGSYFPWFIKIIAAYSLLTQFAKNLFIKKFNSWI